MTLWHSSARRAAFASALLLAAPAAAAPLPGGAGSLVETYQDWVVACQGQEATTNCVIRQVQSNTQNNQVVLTVEFRSIAGGKLEGMLLLPFGLALAKGVTLKIDEAPVGGLAFSTCVPQGCLVPMSLDPPQVAKLKTSTALTIGTSAVNQTEPVALKVSLKGFPAAWNRVAELTK